MLGLSVANGLWSGCIITISFLWGAVFFRDPVKNIWLTLLGLVMLFAGIVGLALCKSAPEPSSSSSSSSDDTKDTMVEPVEAVAVEAINEAETMNHTFEKKPLTPAHQDPEVTDQLSDHLVSHAEILDDGIPIVQKSFTSKILGRFSESRNYFIGIICCLTVGLLSGSVMVPTRYGPDVGIVYIVSFGIGNMIVTPILAIIYFVAKRQMPQFHPKVALPACFSGGILWNIGNVCGTYAVMSPLGLTVGYPLTQCALVVAGLWGILVFKELRGWKAILQFTVSTLLFLLPGCALLALFGKA